MNNGSFNRRVLGGASIALLMACFVEPALPAQAGAANMKLAGNWQYDAAASDDYAARITQLIAEQMTPDAMVGTLLHLVSLGARFVTGQTLGVDGGRYFLG